MGLSRLSEDRYGKRFEDFLIKQKGRELFAALLLFIL